VTSYRVKWEIDIEAKDQFEAAEKAQAIMQDKNSSAQVFDVYLGEGLDGPTYKWQIDLEEQVSPGNPMRAPPAMDSEDQVSPGHPQLFTFDVDLKR
jgi:hypothetical protein